MLKMLIAYHKKSTYTIVSHSPPQSRAALKSLQETHHNTLTGLFALLYMLDNQTPPATPPPNLNGQALIAQLLNTWQKRVASLSSRVDEIQSKEVDADTSSKA